MNKTIKRVICFFLLVMTERAFTQSVAGVLNSNTFVCAGNNNGVLSLQSYSGSIVRWEYANNGSGPWTPILFVSSSYNYLNLLQTTYFRVVVQKAGYAEAYSNTVSVTCDAMSVPGIISAATLQCVNQPATFVLSGHTGSVISWEYSHNSWLFPNSFGMANVPSATLSSVTNSIQVRALVKNGVCPTSTSSPVFVYTVSNSVGGTITGTNKVCAGNNSVSLSLGSYTGFVQQWESAGSSGGPFQAIVAPNAGSLALTNLNQPTWFRSLVKSGNCPAQYSDTFGVHTDAPSVGGAIVGVQHVCSGSNSGSLQVVAHTGSVVQWEYAASNGTLWTVSVATNPVFTFSNLTTTQLFRVQVQNGSCPVAYSNLFAVQVSPAPSASFNANAVCQQASAQFTNTTLGSHLYSWDFGDGGSASIQHPSHTFLLPGSYQVKLTATSAQGCTDSIRKTVTVHPQPQAALVVNDTACYGTTLVFLHASSISSGSIQQVTYRFGDGLSSVTNPTTHLYSSAGTYQAYLVATSNFGCKDSVVRQINVFPKPHASFTAQSACVGSPITFQNSSFVLSGGLSHLWSFGNSASSTLHSPVYTYSASGLYTVGLICQTMQQCSDTATQTVHVFNKPVLQLNASSHCFGEPMNYTVTAQPSLPNYSLNLYFGDGSSTTSFLSSHSYSIPGTFMCMLNVVTDSGCVSTLSKNITVNAKPHAAFYFDNVCEKENMQLVNVSSISSGQVSYSWTVGNIGTSTLVSPGFVFPEAGEYLVSLVAQSEYDCSDTAHKTILVFDAPVADFSFSNSCQGFPVQFKNHSTVSSGIISSNLWDFGDNTTESVLDPSKEYLGYGVYPVKLTVVSSNGCMDTITRVLRVFEGPIADFAVESICLGEKLTCENKSLLSSGSYWSYWNFGDSVVAGQNSPNYLYVEPGQKHIQLKVVSDQGCSDSVSRYTHVYELPVVNAGEDQVIERGFGLQLSASGALTYEWYPLEGLSNAFVANPFASPDTSRFYWVEGMNSFGCRSEDSIRIDVRDGFVVIPYNILTPDQNGLNDTWIVKNIESYPENSLLIFDQWNQKIYETKRYKNDWSGVNQAGDLLPDGTYYYILRFEKSERVYSGYITLLRNRK